MDYDVAVIGAGNAALCAAITAAERGAKTVVLEAAPEGQHGGNSWFTDGAIRFAHGGLDDVRLLLPHLNDTDADRVEIPPYPPDAFLDDLKRQSNGRTDPTLSSLLVHRSFETMWWLHEHDVPFALLYGNQAFEVDGRFHFWGGLTLKVDGKGIALVDHLMGVAQKAGVEVRFETRVRRAEADDGGFRLHASDTEDGAHVVEPAVPSITARSVVLACGSLEASADRRVDELGPQWRDAVVRGSAFNRGDGLDIAIELGAQPAGDWAGCHAVAMDAGAPAYGDHDLPGDIWKRHSYPLGVVVNAEGRRFIDEGADFRNYTYARYGHELLQQPEGRAYQVFDAQVVESLREEYRRPEATVLHADTLEDLAELLHVDRASFLETIRSYNEAVQEGPYNPERLDGKSTLGIAPPKSNWALRINRRPFLAFPVVCGITFSYAGVRVSESAEVLRADGTPIPGLTAAGEMVGGLFYDNYPGGSGLISGSVFGRIAGATAADEAFRRRSAHAGA